MTKNYSQNDYVFLGKQVAEGKYVSHSTFILALILALLVGVAVGRYVLPQGGFSLPAAESGAAGQTPFAGSTIQPDLANNILRHEDTIRQDPNNAEAWAHLGNLYYDAGKAQQAVDAYEKSLELKPGDTSVMVDCGVMYRELGNYEKALEYFRAALKIDPKHEIALFNSGIVLYHDLKRSDEGLAVWRSLVQVNPKAKTPRGDLVSDFIKEHESGGL